MHSAHTTAVKCPHQQLAEWVLAVRLWWECGFYDWFLCSYWNPFLAMYNPGLKPTSIKKKWHLPHGIGQSPRDIYIYKQVTGPRVFQFVLLSESQTLFFF